MGAATYEHGIAMISLLDTGPDAPFRFRRRLPDKGSSDGADAALIESIKRHGVLQPPLLAETERGTEVVSGFRRIAACLAAGLEEAPAYIARGPGAETAHLLPAWLECALHGRPLSEMEKINLAAGVSSMTGGKPGASLQAVSAIFERRITAELLARISRLAELDDNVQEAVHDGRISIGDLLQLDTHPGIELGAAAGLIAGSDLSRSGRRRAIRDILSIADKGEDSFARFLSDGASSGSTLEAALEAAVRPRMRKDRMAADSEIGRMRLPAGVSIRLPESMEGGSCSVEMDFRSEEDLRLAVRKLQEGMEAGTIGRIIDILRGSSGK